MPSKSEFTIIKELECRRFKVLDRCLFQFFSSVFLVTKQVSVPVHYHDFSGVFALTMCISLLSCLFRFLCSIKFFFYFLFELDSVLSCHYGLKVYFLFIFSGRHHDYGILSSVVPTVSAEEVCSKFVYCFQISPLRNP